MSDTAHRRAAAWWRAPHHDAEEGPAFTDFGHLGYGLLDTRVFWQDIYWVDIAGTPHFLVDMSADYRANVIGFLRRGAPGWWHHILFYSTLEAALLLRTSPDDPTTGQAVDQFEKLIELDPDVWIEASPLMRALQGLQRNQERDRP